VLSSDAPFAAYQPSGQGGCRASTTLPKTVGLKIWRGHWPQTEKLAVMQFITCWACQVNPPPRFGSVKHTAAIALAQSGDAGRISATIALRHGAVGQHGLSPESNHQ
jgi:hypothetical protein